MDTNIFNTKITPTWCPGCGNWGIFTALKQALAKNNLQPHEFVVVTDIGCSSNMADFINAYVFHTLHGRALPVAAGIKLANHHLPVIAIIGDGACYGEGLTHFINLMRGNHNITVLVCDNYLYGLTTGQYSPTTIKGTITKSTPNGSIEEALNPLALALANQTTFAGRGYAFDLNHLTSLIDKAINHRGFSLLDILQPCVSFNKTQTVAWYQEKVYKLKTVFKTKPEAFNESLRTDKLAIGIFYQEDRLTYDREDKVLQKGLLVDKKIDKININKLVEGFI